MPDDPPVEIPVDVDWIPRHIRAWLYRLVLIAQLAIAYGLVRSDAANDWLMFVSAVLGIGTAGVATVYTPRK